jgi:hypothetical protein
MPAKDFSHKDNAHKTWDFAFEKQWLFYQLWGRLLYDPSTPNTVFESSFNKRYGKNGALLLKAFTSASNMPLKFASFHAGTWDYTLYSEGFLAPFTSNGGLHDTVSSFVSIDELIDHPTLDPAYISIPDFVKQKIEGKEIEAGKISPLTLADSLEENSNKVFSIVKQLQPGASPTLSCELDDLETWAYLSIYFANKLRAGVSLQLFRTTGEKLQQQRAVQLLTSCVRNWKKIAQITSGHYKEVAYVDNHASGGVAYKDALTFLWAKYLPQVERDVLMATNSKKITSNSF